MGMQEPQGLSGLSEAVHSEAEECCFLLTNTLPWTVMSLGPVQPRTDDHRPMQSLENAGPEISHTAIVTMATAASDVIYDIIIDLCTQGFYRHKDLTKKRNRLDVYQEQAGR